MNRDQPRRRSASTVAMFMAAGAIVLAGCGSVPQPNFYTVKLDMPASNGSNGAHAPALAINVGIERLDSGFLYSEDRIIYRDSEYEVKFWHYRRWIAPPHILVTEHLRDYLSSGNFFANVVKAPSQKRIHYLLEGKLLAFEEEDRNDGWYGKVSFEIALRDMRSDKIVWQNTYAEAVPATQKAPVAIVSAISGALQACFARLGTDLRENVASALQTAN